MAGRFSLVGRNPGDKTLDMHRLVQAVVRDGMDGETRRLWAGRAVNALNQTFPWPKYGNWARCVKGGVNLDHFGGAKADQLVKG